MYVCCVVGVIVVGLAVPNPLEYFCHRKQMFGLLLMAGCDAQRRILSWDCSYTPTTHDSTAFKGSELGRLIDAYGLPEPFFLSGDAAFQPATSSVVTPGGTIHYNWVQSSLRMPIECAFGMLINTWGVLWRPLAVRFDRRAPLLSALIRLHNFRIDCNLGETKHITKVIQKRRNGKYVRVRVTMISEGKYIETPKMDKKGRPVDLLTDRDYELNNTQVASGDVTRRRLEAAIAEFKITRPSPKTNT